jgi:hypothetical protein
MGVGRTSFGWRMVAGTGELEITNLQPNDARWIQKRHLDPGWYFFTGIVRVEGVARGITGANLSLLEDGIISEQLNGSADWKQVGLYLKVGSSGADVILACRLGGFAGLNKGKASFRSLSLSRIDQPPTATGNPFYIYDLDAIRHPGPIPAVAASGPNNVFAVMIVFLFALATLVGLVASSEAGSRALRLVRSHRSAEMPMRVFQGIERPIEITIFLACAATYAYFYQASDHNTASRIDLIRAIVERHTLWIDGYAGYNTADLVQIGPRSHIYSNKAPGGALTGLLPWLLVTATLRLVMAGSGAYWTAVTYLTTVLSVSIICALTAVLVYRLGLHFGGDNLRALAVAFTLAFGTIMFPHATEFAGEPIAAFCEIAAFYVLEVTDASSSWVSPLAAGLLAGWGALCDYPTFLIALTIAGFALWKVRRAKPLIAFIAGAVVTAALLMTYNRLAFGNAFFLSYEAYMLPGTDRFPEQAKGLAGVTYPRLGLLYNILAGPQRGLFFCNPVLIMALPGIYFFWQRLDLRAEFIAITAAIVSFVLFNASYGESIIYWGGGTATGPRHLLPILPFVALTLAFLPKSLNPLFVLLAFISVFLMLMATAVEPHLPYEYTNPFRDFLWPAFSRGDFALNSNFYFERAPIGRNSAAFNLGRLIGLPASMQLWPLGALWAGAGLYLLKLSRIAGQFVRVTKLQIATCAAFLMLFALPTIEAVAIEVRATPREGLLGCYYMGLRPANDLPPHIRRVDSQISFDTIAELGALPSPSSVVWRGSLVAPVTGVYHFTIRVDDLGWLKIDGRTIIADPGDVTKSSDAGSIELHAGKHSIEVGERNLWGEASMHLDWQIPGDGERVVPSQFLIPDNQQCRPG